jgi:hypothetical protein
MKDLAAFLINVTALIPRRHTHPFRLNDSPLRIATFRAVEINGLFRHPILREAERSGQSVLKQLRDQGLVELHTAKRRGWKKKGKQSIREDPFRVVVLTQLGADLLRATGYDEHKNGDLHAGPQNSGNSFMMLECLRLPCSRSRG